MLQVQVEHLEELMERFMKLMIIHIMIHGPVSYTHLDVYKRQVQLQFQWYTSWMQQQKKET